MIALLITVVTSTIPPLYVPNATTTISRFQVFQVSKTLYASCAYALTGEVVAEVLEAAGDVGGPDVVDRAVQTGSSQQDVEQPTLVANVLLCSHQ